MSAPVAIIGAGPAGIEAAVQLRRSRAEFLILEKERIGGLLNEANSVENFPGVPRGVPGRALAVRLRRQLAAAGIAVERSRVISLGGRDGRFVIETEEGKFAAGKVILACGTRPVAPPAPLDPTCLRGRLFASVLPLLKSRGETVAVIGGGDAAFDYALSLAENNRVHILVRAVAPRALPLLVERCRRRQAITIHFNCRLADVWTSESGEIALRTTPASAGRGEIRCQRILTAIGRIPALDFLDPELRDALPGLRARGSVILAGDAGGGRWRYATVAAADGLRAAMEILAGGGPWK